ncbi:MAG TPA: lauroyl acyltransferase [Luteimonas sp.]|nr:lauroyl acyltransferase [Luteimonas sp.]
MPDASAALFALATAVARLPWPWLRGAADALAWLALRLDTRESAVALRNLELAYPDLLPAQRESLRRAVVRSTARQAFETLVLWTRPRAATLGLVREVHGAALFDAAIAAGHGVIVVAPHYGNWELLNQWLAARTPLAILYAPPESALGDAFLRRVRASDGDRVTQVRAEGPGIRQLFKLLRGGGVVGILPDQQPKLGDGGFAPFFGLQASTMTLVGRLAERTGACVLFGYCERRGADLDFVLRFESAPEGIDSADAATALAALNAGVERVARRDPAQYQWTYKRFKARPPGSGEANPYQQLEHR